MPDANKDTTHESQATTGVFDGLSAAPQAEKDARVEDAKSPEKETPEETKPPEPEPEAKGNEETLEEKPPEPEGDEKPPEESPTTEPIVIRGRSFAAESDVHTAYEQSSDEGVRLHNLDVANQHMIQQLQTALVTAEDKIADLPYPELLNDDALDALSPAKQTEYLLKKGKWEDARDTRKTERETLRNGHKEYQENLKVQMDAQDSAMSRDAKEYPSYDNLKSQREDVLKKSPFLADRLEGNYIAYWVSYGIDAKAKLEASKAKTEESKAKAKATAEAAASQSRGGKPSTVTTGKAEGESDIVKAYNSRTSVI